MAKKKTKSKIKQSSIDPFYFNYFAEGGKTNAQILAEARANQADYNAYVQENNIERTMPTAEEIKAQALLYQQQEQAMQQKEREAAFIRDTKITSIPVSEIDSSTSAPLSITPINIPLSSKASTTRESKNTITSSANEKGFSMKTENDVFLPKFDQVTPNIENLLKKEYPRYRKDQAEYLGELASYIYDGVIDEPHFTSDAQNTDRKRMRSMLKSASKHNPKVLINQKDNLINFANKLLKSDRRNPRLMRELFKEFNMSVLPRDIEEAYGEKARQEYYPNNNYEEGGFLKKIGAAIGEAEGLGDKIGGVASGVGSLVSNFTKQASIADTTGIESSIDTVKNTQISGSNDDLMSMYNTFTAQDRVKASDLRRGDAVGGALSGVASGAGAGMAFGPIGAAVGAGVGLLSSIGGSIAGNRKARNKAKKLNKEMQEAEAYRDLSFDNAVSNTDKLMDQNLMANYAAYGGHLSNGTEFKDNLTFFNEGGTHETNPMGGIMIGVDPEGTPNMVEQGEVKWNDYIFSNRLQPDKEDIQLLNMNPSWANKSFAKLAKSLNKESDERPNDPISKRGKEDSYSRLQALQEMKKQKENKNTNTQGNMFDVGGTAKNIINPNNIDYISRTPNYIQMLAPTWGNIGWNPQYPSVTQVAESTPTSTPTLNPTYVKGVPKRVPTEPKFGILEDIAPAKSLLGSTGALDIQSSALEGLKDIDIKSPYDITDPNIGSSSTKGSGSDGYATWSRYAPILGSAIGTGMALFDKPDYSEIDKLKNQINNVPQVEYNPLGNYISPNLIDPNLQANSLKQMGNRNNDLLINSAGGNRSQAAASLLASGYNNQNILGQTLMGIGDANHQRQLQAETFNKDTDATNQRMDIMAQQSNAQSRQYGLRNLMALAEMKQSMKDTHDMSVSANLTNLFNNIGNVGRENFAFNQVNSSNQYYGIRKDGGIYYKPAFYKLNKEDKEQIKRDAKEQGLI